VDFGPWLPVVSKGYLGVDLFFVLSGFVLGYVYQAAFLKPTWAGYSRFLGLRVARIFPAHWGMLLFLTSVVIAMGLLGKEMPHMDRYTLPAFFWNVLNLHAWGPLPTLTWNYPSWSVSAEWFAYCLFPVSVQLLGRIRGVWLNALAALGCLALFYGLLQCFGPLYQNLDAWVTHAFPLVRVLLSFWVGMCVHNMFQAIRLPGWLWQPCALLTLASFYVPVHDLVRVGLFALCILSLATSQRCVLAHPVLVHLGEVSYSVYLVHAVTNAFFEKGLSLLPALPGPIVVLLAVLTALTAGELLYFAIEKPGRQWVKSWLEHPLLKPRISV
jgi:peptidoglycan/LPS O-acetylase OafA/YrhL